MKLEGNIILTWIYMKNEDYTMYLAGSKLCSLFWLYFMTVWQPKYLPPLFSNTLSPLPIFIQHTISTAHVRPIYISPAMSSQLTISLDHVWSVHYLTIICPVSTPPCLTISSQYLIFLAHCPCPVNTRLYLSNILTSSFACVQQVGLCIDSTWAVGRMVHWLDMHWRDGVMTGHEYDR